MKIDWSNVAELVIAFVIAGILLDVMNALFLDDAIAKMANK